MVFQWFAGLVLWWFAGLWNVPQTAKLDMTDSVFNMFVYHIIAEGGGGERSEDEGGGGGGVPLAWF